MEAWTKERIEQELREYRAMKYRAGEYADDLKAWDELREDVAGMIGGAALQLPSEPGMPRGSGTSDPTGRIALCVPDEVHASAAKIKLRRLERRIRRVDRWLAALTNRERIVVQLRYIRGMVWGEVVVSYNNAPADGIPREERTLKRWRKEAVDRIEKLIESENGADLSPICHCSGT